jgi:hypothetical protein
MCDNNVYFVDGDVYLGRRPNQPPETNLGHRIVTQLCRPLYNSGRNLTTDNFYTSIGVARGLYANGLTMLGTIKKNKPEIPPEFLSG